MKETRKPWEYGRLCVKENCPYLCNGEKLFFWMGDTAWLMFHNLNWEDMCIYLENRARRGFNVIQAVAVHHLPAENVYGREAFLEGDITRPDSQGPDSYWDLVDRGIRKAGELGMYVALFPHWGNLASKLTLEEMKGYVGFLAARYGNEPNIIWVTGGDTKGNEAAEYWRTMGSLLKKECPGQLVTFHPFGRTSSIDYFADEHWVDFHMFQSGHRRYDQRTLRAWDDSHASKDEGKAYYGEDNWRYVLDTAKLHGVKPILDAEPSYEHIPQGLHLADEPYWSTQQVRRYGWWSVLAGACGFTYGHNSVMQFFNGMGEGAFYVRLPWKDALHAPACDSMSHMNRVMNQVLMENWQNAGPAQNLLGGASVWKEEQKEERIMAFHAGPWLLCYSYSGAEVELDVEKMRKYASSLSTGSSDPSVVRCSWMNPESGVESYIGSRKMEGDIMRFQTPAGDEAHDDWLLILELV